MLSILKVACAQVACAQVAWSSKLRVLKVACPQCLMVLGSAPFPFSDNICKGVFCIYPVNNVWPFPYCNNQPDLVCHCCWEFAKHASSPCSGQCLTRLRKEQSASSPSHHVGGACQTDTRVAEGIPPWSRTKCRLILLLVPGACHIDTGLHFQSYQSYHNVTVSHKAQNYLIFLDLFRQFIKIQFQLVEPAWLWNFPEARNWKETESGLIPTALHLCWMETPDKSNGKNMKNK